MRLKVRKGDILDISHAQTGSSLGMLIITSVKKTIAKGQIPGEIGTHTVKSYFTSPNSGKVDFVGDLSGLYVGILTE